MSTQRIQLRSGTLIVGILIVLFLSVVSVDWGHGKIDEEGLQHGSEFKTDPIGGRIPEKPEAEDPARKTKEDFTEVNRKTPRGWRMKPTWVKRIDRRQEADAVRLVDYVFELHDKGLVSVPDKVIAGAKPLSSQSAAEAWFLKVRKYYHFPIQFTGKAVDAGDYYLFGSPVGDYFKNIEEYMSKHPPDEHPLCDFVNGYGIAIRKSDGHAVFYSADVVRMYEKGERLLPTSMQRSRKEQ